MVMYADQWNKLIKVVKSGYMDNYIKYNESRLKFKKVFKKNYKKDNDEDEKEDDIIPSDEIEQIEENA